MTLVSACEDCATCDVCHRHTTPDNQWPCLYCHRMLCGSCECVEIHHEETCS